MLDRLCEHYALSHKASVTLLVAFVGTITFIAGMVTSADGERP